MKNLRDVKLHSAVVSFDVYGFGRDGYADVLVVGFDDYPFGWNYWVKYGNVFDVTVRDNGMSGIGAKKFEEQIRHAIQLFKIEISKLDEPQEFNPRVIKGGRSH